MKNKTVSKVPNKQVIVAIALIMIGFVIGTILHSFSNKIQPVVVPKSTSIASKFEAIENKPTEEEIKAFIEVQKKEGWLNLTLKKPRCVYVKPNMYKLIG